MRPIDPAAITVRYTSTPPMSRGAFDDCKPLPWEAVWDCPGCRDDTHDYREAQHTTEDLARIAADARCCVCRRRELAPPKQLTLTMTPIGA